MDLAVGGRRPLQACAGPGRVDEGHDDAARRRRGGGDEHPGGQVGLGHGPGGPVQPPAVAVAHGPHRRDGPGRWPPPRSAPPDSRTSPATTPGSQRACCSAVPNRARGRAPRTTVAHSGTGATARPCCSSTRHSSVSPRPDPPCASGTARPSRLARAKLRPQRVVEPVVGLLDLGHPVGVDHAVEDAGRGLGHRLLLLGEGEVHQAAPASRSRGRRNIGSVSSSSTADELDHRRACRCCTSAGSTPIMSATSRVPSSSSTTAMGSG